MTLIDRIEAHDDLKKADFWLVDTNALFLPSFGRTGVWRSAIPHEIARSAKQDKFTELLLYDINSRLRTFTKEIKEKGPAVILADGQDQELHGMTRYLREEWENFNATYGSFTQVDDLFRAQINLLASVERSAGRGSNSFQYQSVLRQTEKINGKIRYDSKAPWSRSNTNRPSTVDKAIVAQFVAMNMAGRNTALISLDRGVDYLAQQVSGSINDDKGTNKPESQCYDRFWYSFFYKSFGAFANSIRKKGFAFNEREEPPVVLACDENGRFDDALTIPADVAVYMSASPVSEVARNRA